MKTSNRFLWIGLALALAALACRMGAPEPPASPPPVSTEAVENLEATLESAAQQAQESGEVNLEIDEAQLTSLVVFQLQESGDETIQNPQVFLRDGQIQLFGDVEREGISGTAQVTLEPRVDADGRPVLEVASASIGPFPIPGQIVDELEDRLNQAFIEQLQEQAPGTRFESISIADGIMTITGHAR
jgi:hypothetical protein